MIVPKKKPQQWKPQQRKPQQQRHSIVSVAPLIHGGEPLWVCFRSGSPGSLTKFLPCLILSPLSGPALILIVVMATLSDPQVACCASALHARDLHRVTGACYS